ncbi:hypothetical protein T4B_15444 [Trichinella pseudospiralis]|uniref:Uncharacterized protein n=1 Tax=Trichinella pseudospiralis TaxID=6337 RepID=A0A0V1II72_TRIPS|nr:hypothetical protein T4B_15444 [Trichinella pseudospiralis]
MGKQCKPSSTSLASHLTVKMLASTDNVRLRVLISPGMDSTKTVPLIIALRQCHAEELGI